MQILTNGLINGLEIAILALAFTSVYLPTRIFHVALGGIYALVPFVAWSALQNGWGWWLALSSATIMGIALSLACELLNHAPLDRRQASGGAHLVSSLGIYIIIVQSISLIWGSQTQMLRAGLDEVTMMGTISLTNAQVRGAELSTVILVTFYLWLRHSRLGLKIRALADNPIEFALRGHNLRRFRLVAFGVAGLLCSASSLLVAYDLGFSPHGGLAALLPAIVAVIIGGRGSFLGPVVGGILIGVIRSEVVWFLSSRWQDAITFIVLVLFLFIRPNGLLGRKVRLEAEADA